MVKFMISASIFELVKTFVLNYFDYMAFATGKA